MANVIMKDPIMFDPHYPAVGSVKGAPALRRERSDPCPTGISFGHGHRESTLSHAVQGGSITCTSMICAVVETAKCNQGGQIGGI